MHCHAELRLSSPGQLKAARRRYKTFMIDEILSKETCDYFEKLSLYSVCPSLVVRPKPLHSCPGKTPRRGIGRVLRLWSRRRALCRLRRHSGGRGEWARGGFSFACARGLDSFPTGIAEACATWGGPGEVSIARLEMQRRQRAPGSGRHACRSCTQGQASSFPETPWFSVRKFKHWT